MALPLAHSLQHGVPFQAGASSFASTCCVNASTFHLSVKLKRLNGGNRAPRRIILGLGASFLSQFMGMGGIGGGKSFLSSARQQGISSVEQVLKNVEWAEEFTFKEEDFQRFDESPDSLFYKTPRFVTHIDDPAICALTKYYSKVFPPSSTPGVSLLDLCSSWVSHFPAGYKQDRVVG